MFLLTSVFVNCGAMYFLEIFLCVFVLTLLFALQAAYLSYSNESCQSKVDSPHDHQMHLCHREDYKELKLSIG